MLEFSNIKWYGGLLQLFPYRVDTEYQRIISGWGLRYNGDIYSSDRPMIAQTSLCYGYNIQKFSVYAGCELWEQPSCRNHNETFVLKSGHFANGDGCEPIAESAYDNDDNASLTESDCRENCWKDCECVGFRSGYEYGCSYWKGKILTFVQSYDGSEPKQFVLVSEASNKTESSTKSKFISFNQEFFTICIHIHTSIPLFGV
ncbi:unnamed protein product [Fraxinus pennsylvanica]|uniref:Apple domain-containing protein n=1 Tax=Fraxinus pennsylvanica TaxID=56036 RepID=A0AAD2E081_9LAMI|nr:unnamed protein product [Fraxinus pennsylvanica]